MRKYFFLFFFLGTMLGMSFASVNPNPIISRGKTVYTSMGEAPQLVDNIFGWSSFTVNNGSWIALELGSGYSQVFFNWNNPGYSWSDAVAASSSCKQGTSIPVDYSIQVCSNSTDGSDGDWESRLVVSSNTVTSRGHLINFENATWIKIEFSSGGGIIDEIEVFDISSGGNDIWFFPGTSISANVYKASLPNNTYADVVTRNYSGFTPAMVRGGIPCINSTSFAEDFDLYLENAGDTKFWAIEMGTNDAWGGSNYNVETFRSNLQTVINKCKENKIEPIVARMIGTNEEAAGWQVHPDYLTAIDELTADNGLIEGPDLYAWFSAHPEDLASDGVHPSESGCISMQRLWAEQMATLYTGSSIPVEGVVLNMTELTIMEGETKVLQATVLPSNATNKSVIWSSSDENIATMSSGGNIEGISVGTAKLTVTTVDGGFTDICMVQVIADTVSDEYMLQVSVVGKGDVVLSPEGGIYQENTVVTLTALPGENAEFIGWSGDISGTSETHSLVMDGDKSVTASFTSPYEPCDSYTNISLPIVQNGVGEYCWETSGSIENINSWNVDYLEINGVDVKNKYIIDLPPKIDDKYYIQSIASLDWAYVEIAGTNVSSDKYTLVVNTTVGGTVNPESGVYAAGANVSLTATPDDGYDFTVWGGDASGTNPVVSVTMDSDKSLTATFIPDNIPCEASETVSVPLSKDGIGEYCWVTTDDIAWVNSWNMASVEINGVDFTNVWSGNLPGKIDNTYFIYYNGLYNWSHLEIAGTKSADLSGMFLSEADVFPNPFEVKTNILIASPEKIRQLSLIDATGKTVYSFTQSEIKSKIEWGTEINSGIYFLRIVTQDGIQIHKIIKR